MSSLRILFLCSFHLIQVNSDIVTFVNGDRLSGQLQGQSVEGDLEWSATNLKDQVELDQENIAEIQFESSKKSQESVLGNIAEVKMHRGDVFIGRLISLSSQELVLTTEYSDDLTIQRRMVESVNIYDSAEVLFRDLGEIEDWSKVGNRDAWRKEENIFVSFDRGGISRNVSFTDQNHISFQLHWENHPRIKLCVNASEGGVHDPNSSIDIGINRRTVSARLRHNGESFNVGQKHNLTQLSQKESTKVDLYFNKETMQIHLGGEVVAQWVFPEMARHISGEWLHLISESSNRMAISELQVRAWNGVPETPSFAMETDDVASSHQLIRLNNGDPVTGTVLGLKMGMLAIDSPLGEISLPLDRVQTLDYSHDPYEEAKRYQGDTRIYLKNGSVMTAKLTSWRNEEVIVSSQNFGESRLKSSEIRKVSFNIYQR